MKDPTGEILTAFTTDLASIAYNGTTWHVYKEQPPQGKRNYIYLAELSFNEDGDKDHIISKCNLLIEISTIKNKYSKTIANDLSNSILLATENITLSMTNFYMIISGYTNNVNQGKEDQGDRYIKQILLNFDVQQKTNR